jgi:hypothetical protein
MDETLDFFRRELSYRLGLADDQVVLDNARTPSRASDTRGVVITLINVGVSTYQGSVLKQPGWQDLLELTVLVSYRFKARVYRRGRASREPLPPRLGEDHVHSQTSGVRGTERHVGHPRRRPGAFGGLQCPHDSDPPV